MKTCLKCGETKPIEMFYRNPTMADGHLNKCKACIIAYGSENYRRKIKNPVWNIAMRQRSRLKYAEKRAAGHVVNVNKERLKHWLPGYLLKSRARRLVHLRVWNAIQAGKLIRQACEKCGNTKTQAHHDDYSKPLDVRWLCAPCHSAHHVALRERELLSQAEPVYYFRTTIPVREEHA